jgi:hypothetical protein
MKPPPLQHFYIGHGWEWYAGPELPISAWERSGSPWTLNAPRKADARNREGGFTQTCRRPQVIDKALKPVCKKQSEHWRCVYSEVRPPMRAIAPRAALRQRAVVASQVAAESSPRTLVPRAQPMAAAVTSSPRCARIVQACAPIGPAPHVDVRRVLLDHSLPRRADVSPFAVSADPSINYFLKAGPTAMRWMYEGAIDPPALRFVLLMRDPLERTFSNWNMFRCGRSSE